MSECEIVTKRTNLALFLEYAVLRRPKKAFFHITHNGDELPPMDAFYKSINMSVPARPSLFPVAKDVRVERVNESSTDLCPRAHVLQNSSYSHAFFINDGARGPLLAPGASQTRGDGFPAWLTPYMTALEHEPTVAVVGATMSCELAPHLQSWAMLMDKRVQSIFERAYDMSCTLDKPGAISVAEVGPYKDVFEAGYAMSSVSPEIPYVAQEEAQCLVDGSSPDMKLALNGCINPWGDEAHHTITFNATATPPYEIVFAKFGGEQWRHGWLPDSYANAITDATYQALRTRGCPKLT